VRALKNFFNPGSFARGAAFAAFSRLGALWRSRARMTALVLVAALLANAMGQEPNPKPRPAAALDGVGLKTKATLATAAVVTAAALIGVGVYVVIQHAHTVTGCVTDDPNVLLLHTGDGKTYVLLGATTKIKANTRIKVRGTKRKTIPGVIDEPSFVVEKLAKTYGTCSVTPATPATP
jgi:hypothetical protein